jgi:AcrR family transcriptional regulator
MPIEVRRQQVLDAALRLISRDGYSAASMEAIAREAELAKPRVYSAYPGRGPLLSALFQREQQRAIATLADAMPSFVDGADFDDTLVAATRNLLDAVAANPDPWRLLAIPATDAPPEVQQHFAAAERFALTQLRALLEWGATNRPGLSELDLELAALAILAIGEQAVRLILTQPKKFSAARYAEFARTLAYATATSLVGSSAVDLDGP